MGEAAGPRRARPGVQSVELQLDPAGDTLVTDVWQRLLEAGLPSQGRHRSPSNRPHITLVAVPDLPPGAEDAVRDVMLGRLPAMGVWGDVTLFGAGPWTVVWLVAPTPALLDLQARVAEVCAVPPDQLTAPHHWTPHVTLARRVYADARAAVLDLLTAPVAAAAGSRVVAPSARRWDGAARREWPVGQADEA